MKRSLVTAALLVAATAAQAESNVTTLYYHDKSYWTVRRVDRNSGGVSMCTMTSQFGPKDKTADAWIYVKYKPGVFVLHIEKRNWNFRANARIPLNLTFDGKTWSGYGVAFQQQNNKNDMLEVAFDIAVMPNFLKDFSTADKLELSFDHGNERSWIASMTGSRDASEVFAACAAALDNSTQPREAPQDTQPEEGPRKPDKKTSST